MQGWSYMALLPSTLKGMQQKGGEDEILFLILLSWKEEFYSIQICSLRHLRWVGR